MPELTILQARKQKLNALEETLHELSAPAAEALIERNEGGSLRSAGQVDGVSQLNSTGR